MLSKHILARYRCDCISTGESCLITQRNNMIQEFHQHLRPRQACSLNVVADTNGFGDGNFVHAYIGSS